MKRRSGCFPCGRPCGLHAARRQQRRRRATGRRRQCVRPRRRAAGRAGAAGRGRLDCVTEPAVARGAARRRRQGAIEQGSREDPRAQPCCRPSRPARRNCPGRRRSAGWRAMFSIAASRRRRVRKCSAAGASTSTELDQTIITDRDLMAAAECAAGSAARSARPSRCAMPPLIERIARRSDRTRRSATRIGNYIAFRAIAEATAPAVRAASPRSAMALTRPGSACRAVRQRRGARPGRAG